RTAEEQRAAWVREKEYATTRRADLLKQYDEVKEQRDKIEQLGPEGTCPTCRRPLGAEYAEVLGVLDRQMQAIVEDGKYFRQRLDVVRAELTKLEPVALEAAKLAERAKRAEILVREAELAEQALSLHEHRARELAAAVAAERFSEQAFAAARERHDRAARALG